MFKKIFEILDLKYQLKVFYLLLLYLPLNLIETFSLSSIPGFIILISEPITLKNYFPNFQYLNYLISLDIYERAIWGALLLASIFLLRSLFILFVNWFDYSLRYKINILNSKRLFSAYLYKPYIFHLDNSSSRLIQNMNDSLRSTSAIFSFLNIIKDVVLIVFIIVTISIVSPNNFYYLFIFTLIPMTILFFLIKNIVKNLGSLARSNRIITHKNMSEGFLNIKFLKIQNKQKQIIKDFINAHSVAQKNETKLLIINSLPKLILEFLSLIFIILFISLNLKNQQTLNDIIPVVTLIVVAAVRLIPSFSQISINLSNLKFNQSTIAKINEEIKNIKLFSRKKINEKQNLIDSFKSCIVFDQVKFNYKENNELIKKISFKILKNQKVAIVGNSGVGKSTLSDLFMGLLKPLEGKIKVDDISIFDDLKGWRKQISYVPQNIILFDGTIKENICFSFSNTETFNEINYINSLKVSGLDKIIKEFPDGEDTNIGYLASKISGGQKQRIGIARAIYSDNPIIIMDEATNSLDEKSENNILEKIFNENNKTILIISHNPNVLKLCDKLINLNNGK